MTNATAYSAATTKGSTGTRPYDQPSARTLGASPRGTCSTVRGVPSRRVVDRGGDRERLASQSDDHGCRSDGRVARPLERRRARRTESPEIAHTRHEGLAVTPRSVPSETADEGYFAYTQTRRGHPNAADVSLKSPGAACIRVNSPRSTSLYANLDIDNVRGGRLVFEQRSRRGIDLKLWDVDAGGRSDPAPGVNTAAAESKPSISGQYLLFGRGPIRAGGIMTKVILFDLDAGTSRRIATAPRRGIVLPARSTATG
jgi:hypothetical protein